jgi:hypothetical protein
MERGLHCEYFGLLSGGGLSPSRLPAKIELAQARAGSSRREESRLIWRNTFFW